MNVEAQELFGFGVGDFEEREVRRLISPFTPNFFFASRRKANHFEFLTFGNPGDPKKEKFGLPFRLTSDLDHISYQKEPHALCQFFRWLATQRGMGELKLEDHVIATRFHPVLLHASRRAHRQFLIFSFECGFAFPIFSHGICPHLAAGCSWTRSCARDVSLQDRTQREFRHARLQAKE